MIIPQKEAKMSKATVMITFQGSDGNKEKTKKTFSFLTSFVAAILLPIVELDYIQSITLTYRGWNSSKKLPSATDFEIVTDCYADEERKISGNWDSVMDRLTITVGKFGKVERYDAKSPDEAAEAIHKSIAQAVENKISTEKSRLKELEAVKKGISKNNQQH